MKHTTDCVEIPIVYKIHAQSDKLFEFILKFEYSNNTTIKQLCDIVINTINEINNPRKCFIAQMCNKGIFGMLQPSFCLLNVSNVSYIDMMPKNKTDYQFESKILNCNIIEYDMQDINKFGLQCYIWLRWDRSPRPPLA